MVKTSPLIATGEGTGDRLQGTAEKALSRESGNGHRKTSPLITLIGLICANRPQAIGSRPQENLTW
jgi:hypothetical protein